MNQENELIDTRVKDAVLDVLEHNFDARNNNQVLCARVYEYLGYPTDLLKIAYIKDAPSVETITRWRRKWVESYPKLKGTKEVEEQRQDQIANYKQIALINVCGVYRDDD